MSVHRIHGIPGVVIKVKLFAIVRDKAARGDVSLELPEDATVADAIEKLSAELPAIASHLPRCAFALNFEYTSVSEPLNDGDELAVIPPVSGG
ncbi:MoaD/ThiS family protein [soil metagenome]